MAAINDRYDNVLTKEIFTLWCKTNKYKTTDPSVNKAWTKAVRQGQIFLLSNILFDMSNPKHASQIVLGGK